MTERAARNSHLDRLAPLLMFILVLASGFVTTQLYEWPVPRVHDEFAYLLAGDTVASGRITNPPNPEPLLLETFHVIQQPSYQSKYPPGQGLFLGIGQMISGHPAWGIWLAMALATAAMTRLLMFAMPTVWAMILSLIPLLCPPLFWQWTQSYWGGGVAYAASALFFLGVAMSLQEKPRAGGIIGMVGVLLLSQSRPLEGGLTCALTLIAAWGLFYKGSSKALLKITIWMVLAGGLAMAFTLFYNQAVTGEALEFPHRHWAKGVREAGLPEQLRTYTGSKPRSHLEELLRAGRYFIGPALLFVIPGLALMKKRRNALAGFVIVGLLIATSIQISAAHPHYLAPILPLVCGLLAMAWWTLWQHPRARIFAGVLLAAHFAYGGGRILYRIYQRPQWDRFSERADIQQKLQNTPDQDLIFVRYVPGHDVHAEYVYNTAKPAMAPVIWAREGNAEQRAALLKVYPKRTIWLLEADVRPNTLAPYPDDQR